MFQGVFFPTTRLLALLIAFLANLIAAIKFNAPLEVPGTVSGYQARTLNPCPQAHRLAWSFQRIRRIQTSFCCKCLRYDTPNMMPSLLDVNVLEYSRKSNPPSKDTPRRCYSVALARFSLEIVGTRAPLSLASNEDLVK